jgi:multiple sugar transport system substrate-binding protein
MKRKTRALSLVLAAVLLCTIGLTGCGQASSASSTAPASSPAAEVSSVAPKKDVTLKMIRWGGEHADYQKELLKDFENETGIKVVLDAVDYAQMFQKIQLNATNAKADYDLIWAQEIWMPQFIKDGYFLPLNDYISKGVAPGLNLDMYNQNMLKIAKDDKGNVYGLPTYAQTPILAYNKEMLEKNSIAVPDKWTWETTLDVAKKLKSKGLGIALPAKQGQTAVDVFIALARSNGADYFDKDGKLNLTDPAFIAAGNFYAELSKYAMDGSTTWHYDEVNKAIQYGQAALGITASGLAGLLEGTDSTVAGKIGYDALPYEKQTYGTLATWNWCVAKNSANPEEAFKLAAWLCSKDIEKKQTEKNGQISAITELFSDPSLVKNQPWLPAVGKAFEHSDTQPLMTNSTQLTDAMAVALSAIATGDKTATQAFTETQNTLAANFNK